MCCNGHDSIHLFPTTLCLFLTVVKISVVYIMACQFWKDHYYTLARAGHVVKIGNSVLFAGEARKEWCRRSSGFGSSLQLRTRGLGKTEARTQSIHWEGSQVCQCLVSPTFHIRKLFQILQFFRKCCTCCSRHQLFGCFSLE